MCLTSCRAATLLILLTLASPSNLLADLVAGPMLSHVDMREATVWVQTESPSEVRIAYTEQGDKKSRMWSQPITTDRALSHTAILKLDAVEPGKRYDYRVEVNGKLDKQDYQFQTPVHFQGRTPPPDLRIAVGGAHYVAEEGFEPPYQTLGGGYDIFSAIHAAKPDLMIWAGNTAHLRASDWTSRSGTLKRFASARNIAQLQPLLASIPHYATWGNSDYSPHDAGHHYSYRHIVEQCFATFWPRPVSPPLLEGIATRFSHADVDFFMLDVRSYRDDAPASDRLPKILGDAQIEWLRQEILRSTATFKIIIAGAPILNPADNRNNLSHADQEHTKLLRMLRDEKISGLFFISGGKYYGELTRLVHASGYNLFDLTVGPLTANAQSHQDELNFFRMPGSSTYQRHFALVDVSGPEEDRILTLRVMNADGSELWQRSLKASQLQQRN